MSDDFKGFDARLRRIDRNHRAMAHGYQIHMQRDGLIVAARSGAGGAGTRK